MGRALRAAAAGLLFVLPLTLTAPVGAADTSTSELTIAGGPTSALDSTPISIDSTLYLPSTTPAPSVVLAHGFGGSKASTAEQARQLQDAGFVVLTYSARGFGKTIGTISMNSPQFEVADARALVDYLVQRTEVLKDSAKNLVKRDLVVEDQ